MAEASSPSASSMRPWSSNTLAAWSSSNGLASTRETRCRVQDRPNSATVEQSKSNYPSTMAMTRSSRHAAPDFFNSLLDVSVKETSICIVDDTGRIVREMKVASEPEALLEVLMNPSYHFKRIGLEAGPLSQWLFGALAEAGLPVICVETRHMRAVLKAQINKTDRNDARGMAQMMRVGLYRPVHVKTLRSQKLRMLLTHRKLLQSKAIAIDN